MGIFKFRLTDWLFLKSSSANLPSLYVFIDDTIPASSDTLSKLYHDNKDEDGFMYTCYASENTFGKNI